jgi:hypothetical protein
MLNHCNEDFRTTCTLINLPHCIRGSKYGWRLWDSLALGTHQLHLNCPSRALNALDYTVGQDRNFSQNVWKTFESRHHGLKGSLYFGNFYTGEFIDRKSSLRGQCSNVRHGLSDCISLCLASCRYTAIMSTSGYKIIVNGVALSCFEVVWRVLKYMVYILS